MKELVNIPGIRAFWAAFDPLDLMSDSIDPLGFQQGYLALADCLLPSLTTISNVPRYLPMLCAALARAEKCADTNGALPSHIRQQRLPLVLSFERAWALACGLAARNGVGPEATLGLRGVSYVDRRLADLQATQSHLRMSSYNLLANQVRYGAIGVYSVLLEECHLADMKRMALKPAGELLAERFPAAPQGAHDESARLSMSELREWGRAAHCGTMTKLEAHAIEKALSGGDEANENDHIRYMFLKMLAGCPVRLRNDEKAVLQTARVSLSKRKPKEFPLFAASRILAGLILVEPYESFYQACLFIFLTMLGAASNQGAASVDSVAGERSVSQALRLAIASARALFTSTVAASRQDAGMSAKFEKLIDDSGLAKLAKTFSDHPSPQQAIYLLLDRHKDVQCGKLDRNLPKAPWMRVGSNGQVELTAQRHALPVSKRPKSWMQVPRHPYRTQPAFRFIQQCEIS